LIPISEQDQRKVRSPFVSYDIQLENLKHSGFFHAPTTSISDAYPVEACSPSLQLVAFLMKPSTRRRELMHMLHNRRKAEIEILCSRIRSHFSQQPNNSFPFNVQDDHSLASDPDHTEPLDEPPEIEGASRDQLPSNSLLESRSPLLQYLFDKITHFVASAQVS